MIAYFDTSVVLSVLFNDDLAEKASEWWTLASFRLSSRLLEAEALVVLRRHAHQHRRGRSWLSERESRLQHYLQEAHIKELDGEVLNTLRRERRLSKCRTLDALHLAAALVWQQASDEPIQCCCFDERLQNGAESVGLKLPE